MNHKMIRGDIYYADLSGTVGCEQGGIRPVIILQNDIGNIFSPTTIVAPITSQTRKRLPTHVFLHKGKQLGLKLNSHISMEQIRTIDKTRLKDYIGSADEKISVQTRINIKNNFFKFFIFSPTFKCIIA